MILLLIKRFWPYIAAVMVAISIYSVGHMKGTSSCEIKSAKKESAAVKEGIKEHGKIEAMVMSLDDASLDRRLQHWFRD